MLSGPIPGRILRAAQFHESVVQLVDWGRQGEVSYVPKRRTQLVAARTVARRSLTWPSPQHLRWGLPGYLLPRLRVLERKT